MSLYFIKVLFISSYVSFIAAVQVQVEQGVLEGEILETVDGVASYYSFKGIPYAAPPVGDLRFQAPRAPLSWYGVRNSTDHGAMCPQYDDFTGLYVNETEDCLFLNVYSPDIEPQTLLPVMFYIHGGGFKFGSGDVRDLGPDFLVSKNVIIVTFNYRLDALGYLCLDTEQVPGNAGSKDQVAALRWVISNIANFGGDPDNITVLGQSAGAASVGYFLVSPMTRGLFKRAIMMSGTPLSEWVMAFKPAERGVALGKLLGSSTNDPQETYEFLKTVSIDSLVNQTVPIILAEENLLPIIAKSVEFVPVVEKDFGQERFLTAEVLDLLENESVQDVDILFGTTDQETVVVTSIYELWASQYELFPDLQTPREMIYKLSPDKNLEVTKMIHQHYFGNNTIGSETIPEYAKLLNDEFVIYSVYRFINKLPVSNSTKKFAYIFSALTERNVYGWLGEQYGLAGAAHIDDLGYLFDPKSKNLTLDVNATGYQVIESLTTLFTNFAKYGHPTPDNSFGFVWPEYTISGGEYLNIGVDLIVNSGIEKETQEFWKCVHDFSGIKY